MIILLDTLARKKSETPPVWIMRQAGRYLPEYRAIRSGFSHFVEFCLTPDAVAEVTLQPLKRFDLDAAIIFSDILMIPYAFGQQVDFLPNHGPVLGALPSQIKADFSTLTPVYQGLSRTRNALPDRKALIGFAGAPWTLLVYMLGLKTSKTELDVEKFTEKLSTARLWISPLVEAIVQHLSNQIQAGAMVVKVFDSWAGFLAPQPDLYEEFCLTPMRQIAEGLRSLHPDVPLILFSRGAGVRAADIGQIPGVAFACDESYSDADRLSLQSGAVIQTGITPEALIAGGPQMVEAIRQIRQRYFTATDGQRFIFNLTHGIRPETPIAHVSQMIDVIKND